MQPVSLKLDNFQGPLELLLYLIQKSEIDVLDVPLQTITSQFYELLEEEGALEQGGDFLSHASALLLLKSRSLLPGSKGDEEGLDVKLEILEKIREYCVFKMLAKDLGTKGALEQDRHPRGFREKPVKMETELTSTSLAPEDLASLLEEVLQRASYKPEAIQEEAWPLPEVLAYFKERLAGDQAIAFDHLFSPSKAKGHLISLFLVLLELMKHQEVVVVDRGSQNIWIEAKDG